MPTFLIFIGTDNDLRRVRTDRECFGSFFYECGRILAFTPKVLFRKII